jgi:dTDP-4-dehydrorhamnose reductase
LSSQLVGRSDADITDPIGVDALLRQLRPWAVINAAGYVRVDEAEANRDACWRANVSGPITLAAACRRRGLALVTFSSDLVFDGSAGRPYTEEDDPNPLNAYGESKAEAERRVLELLPDALVVRTSAFFGPWDHHNYLAHVMRALDAGEDFHAPADTAVSPTYVPHLDDATHDLLVDGESGIWHLANRDTVTWLEFARLAASLCGRGLDRIRPAVTASVWRPAVRPPYTPLSTVRGALMPPLEDALAAWADAWQDPRVRIFQRTRP